MGVEEEFLLVDPESGAPVGRAPTVLAKAAELPPAAPDAALHGELLGSQVEAATGVCTTTDELRRQLVHARMQLIAAAAEERAVPVSTGTPVLGAPAQPGTGERFDLITGRFAGIVADYEACGCHVHVGVPDRETAVAVINHVRPWLPTLIALSVNSPYHRGDDTGHQSWRMVQQSRFPGSGITPWFPSAAAYSGLVARLVECGIVVDERMSFWLARPSEHVPTVEFRVADAALTVEDAVLQAALSRALVGTALRELAAGREAVPYGPGLDAPAVWSAARHGVHGPAVDLVRQRQVPAVDLVRDLLVLVAPALEDTGELAAVRRQVATVLTGTGADRQRAASAAGLMDVVRMLIRTMTGYSGAAAEPPGEP